MIRCVIASASATDVSVAGSSANSSPRSGPRDRPAQLLADPVGDCHQELVAGSMPKRVVDDLEVVEVEEHDDRRDAVSRASAAEARPPRRRRAD
jgi:hypothetical protein